MADPQPTFWGTVWSTLKAIGIKLGAPFVAILVVVVGIVLAALGFKELQVGGLLSSLLKALGLGGKSVTPIDISNSIPPNRVDPSGKIIPQGTPDQQGQTQAVVVPIQGTGGLFSNPSTVTITPPGTTTPVVIQLPTGVKASDVASVVIVSPGNFVVTVKDSSGINAQQIDDVLKRYGAA
jgi:hypothetical protein